MPTSTELRSDPPACDEAEVLNGRAAAAITEKAALLHEKVEREDRARRELGVKELERHFQCVAISARENVETLQSLVTDMSDKLRDRENTISELRRRVTTLEGKLAFAKEPTCPAK